MTAPEQSEKEEALGAEFWVQPVDALTPTFGFMYAQALAALRLEVRERSGSVIEFMLIERIAFMYAYLRQRESDSENDMTDRTRREMNKDWLEISMTLRKMWGSEDNKNAEEVILRKVNKAIFEATKELPADQAKELQNALAGGFEAVGL